MTRLCLLLVAALAACSSRTRVEILPEAPGYEENWRAARDVFREANVELHEALLKLEPTSLDAAVWGEIKLSKAARAQMATLGERGALWARRAIKIANDGAEGHLYLALNLAFSALGMNRAQAFLGGLAGDVRDALERAIAIDPNVGHGAAHQLRGRFLTMVPWPYRDREEAQHALAAARGAGDTAQTHLYLGDLHHLEGRTEEAAAAWQRAAEAPPHRATRNIDDYVRDLARRRLVWLDKR